MDIQLFKTELLKAISASFRAYKTHGARSTEKLKPLHRCVAAMIQKVWGDAFTYHYLDQQANELTIDGKYYPKDVDIAVSKNNRPIFCVGIKFVTSNYKQNANNYFESMMGETANIQAADIPYAHLIVLRHRTPYYLKNDAANPHKIEQIDEHDLIKYARLALDARQAHRPLAIGIFMVDIDERSMTAAQTDMTQSFGREFLSVFDKKLSLRNFLEEIECYKNAFLLNNK